jgi:hypothetical protein
MTAVVTPPANATPAQLSCDTSRGNGPLHQTVITTFAQMPDPKEAECGSWEPRFPNARVNRITPLTTTGDPVELVNTVPASYYPRGRQSRDAAGRKLPTPERSAR